MTKKKFTVAVTFLILASLSTLALFVSRPLLRDELTLRFGSEQQRMAATERLIALHHFDALPGLVRALKDPDSEIQEAASHGLLELGHDHPEAIHQLFEQGLLESDPLDQRRRFPFFVRNALLNHGEDCQGILLSKLNTPKDADRRLAILKVLSLDQNQDAEKSIRELLALLRKEDPGTYERCFALLLKAPLREWLLAATKSLDLTSLPAMPQTLLRVLTGSATDADKARLFEELKSERLDRCLAAARALRETTPPPGVLPYLRTHLRSYAAAKASEDIAEARRQDLRICRFLDLLGSMQAHSALPEVLTLLDKTSDENTVAERAAKTLPLIDPKGTALSSLSKALDSAPVNPFVLDALEAYGPRARSCYPSLLRVYKREESPQTRHRIVEILSRAPDLSVRSFLSGLAKTGNRYEQSLARGALQKLSEK